MAQPFIGEVRMFAGNFAPAGWAFCDGSLLAISENDALFALIGTTYGGDGRTTFALPDLRGRSPVHQGTGAGLSTRVMGQAGGTETVTLTSAQIPAHGYAGSTVPSDTNRPGTLAVGGAYATGAADGAAIGGGQPHENRPPYLAVNFIISLFGIFPSQA